MVKSSSLFQDEQSRQRRPPPPWNPPPPLRNPPPPPRELPAPAPAPRVPVPLTAPLPLGWPAFVRLWNPRSLEERSIPLLTERSKTLDLVPTEDLGAPYPLYSPPVVV